TILWSKQLLSSRAHSGNVLRKPCTHGIFLLAVPRSYRPQFFSACLRCVFRCSTFTVSPNQELWPRVVLCTKTYSHLPQIPSRFCCSSMRLSKALMSGVNGTV